MERARADAARSRREPNQRGIFSDALGDPVAWFLRYLLPVSNHPDWRWRVLDTFDWYSPRYQSKHTYEEVFRWFESEGLISNRVLGYPIGVSGEKPLRN